MTFASENPHQAPKCNAPVVQMQPTRRAVGVMGRDIEAEYIDAQKCLVAIAKQRDAAIARAEQAEQWVRDLQSGMFVNCVYCGHRYGPDPGTPVSMADVLKAHVEECPKHPMSALKRELARAVVLLQALVGSAELAELEVMAAIARAVPAPDSDKADAVNAIEFLIEHARTAAKVGTDTAAKSGGGE